MSKVSQIQDGSSGLPEPLCNDVLANGIMTKFKEFSPNECSTTGRSDESPTAASLLRLFINQALKTPANVAMIDTPSKKSVTFQTLYKSAQQLSYRVMKASQAHAKYESNEFVAILLPASVQLVKSTLAIWLAGKIAVPLNIDYPIAQLKYILEDQLRNPLIITTSEALQMIGLDIADAKTQVVSPDKGKNSTEEKHVPTPCNEVAYCFFTSGSTGRPKGVLVRHSSYVNVIEWEISACNLTADDRSSVFCSPAFDISILEIWPVLCAGGCLCIPRNHYRYDANLLGDWIHEERITITALPTAVGARILANEGKNNSQKRFSSLRWMLIGGEALTKFPSPNLPFRIMNMYGPTETAVLTTCIPLDSDGQRHGTGIPSIGKPINDHVRVYLLKHETGELITETGEVGEICIAGIGVAKAYLNQPQLTTEKFIPNPFSDDERFSSIYKSGDLGSWNSDGNLCYVGRGDFQIKFHGFRIELGNIEQALGSFPEIDQAIILVEEADKGKALVAYCTAYKHADFAECIAQIQQNLYPFLSSRLGHYEIPSQIYVLPHTQQFPLTTAGKIDRRKLPELKSISVLIKSNHEPPEKECEIMVAQTWSELLNIPFSTIGKSDNFFGLGGNSMMALQMLNRLQCMLTDKNLKISGLHLHHIFRAQTVGELGNLVEQSIVTSRDLGKLVDMNLENRISLSKAQQLIWGQMSQLPQMDWYQFYQSISLNFREISDVEILKTAVDKVLERHDILSYTFHFDVDGSRSSAHFVQAETPRVETIDLLDSPGSWSLCKQILDTNSSRTIENGNYLVTFHILKLGRSYYNIHIIGHQLLLDVTSFNILIWELQQLIQVGLGNEDVASEADLNEKPKCQYNDFEQWQNQFSASAQYTESLQFWSSYLRDWSPVESLTILDVRVDMAARRSYAGILLPFCLDSDLTQKLEDYSKNNQLTVYNLLVTAFKILLHLYTRAKSSDIAVLSIVLGRDQLEFNETVGHFTNQIPVRTRNVAGTVSFESFAKQVHENVTAVYEHSEVPFQNVAACISVDSDPERLFNFCINMTPRSPTHLTSTRNIFQTYGSDLTTHKIMLTFEEVKEDTHYIEGFLEANSNTFSSSQLQDFVRCFKQILSIGLTTPSKALESLLTTECLDFE